jgi:hypothetical protein
MHRGSCLCGAVTYRFETHGEGIYICHCSVCRRITGSAFAATLLADRKGFAWLSGRDHIRTFSKPTGLSVSFCEICGSHLPDTEPVGTIYPVPAGTVLGELDVPVLEHIYVGSKASWDEIGDSAPRWDEDSAD